MGGSPDVEVPEQSQEEKDLLAEQTALLRQQRELLLEQNSQSQLILPYLLKESGFKPVFNERGQITSIEEIPEEEDPQKTLREEIETQLLQRSQKALAGELPIDPALTRDLGSQEEQLRESLRKQLGSGYATSDPGIRALGDFFERKSVIEQGARNDQLTLAEQLGLARTSANLQQSSYATSALSGVPMSVIAGLGGVAQGYNFPLQSYQDQRRQQFQANLFNAQNSSSPLNSIFGLAGTLGGAYLGGPGFAKLF